MPERYKNLDPLFALSKISCSEQEKEELMKGFSSLLEYIATIEESSPDSASYEEKEGSATPLREDLPGELLDKEEFLNNSPAHIGGLIKVPSVIQF